MKRCPMREIDDILQSKLRQATHRLRADPECLELREIWNMAAEDLARHRKHWLKASDDDDEPDV